MVKAKRFKIWDKHSVYLEDICSQYYNALSIFAFYKSISSAYLKPKMEDALIRWWAL